MPSSLQGTQSDGGNLEDGQLGSIFNFASSNSNVAFFMRSKLYLYSFLTVL